MRILIVGGYGTIGKRLTEALNSDHEVLTAGRSKGDLQVDIADFQSIQAMFDGTGTFDAIVSAAGQAAWKEFDRMTGDDYYLGIRSKLMGQVNLVRIGRKYLNKPGSITLTTGILGDHPVPGTTGAAMVNGGLHSFAKAIALELEEGVRVNIVCPALVEDSAERLGSFFPGQAAVSMQRVAAAYIECIEGNMSGEVIRVYH